MMLRKSTFTFLFVFVTFVSIVQINNAQVSNVKSRTVMLNTKVTNENVQRVENTNSRIQNNRQNKVSTQTQSVQKVQESPATTIGPETATTWDGRECGIVYTKHPENPHQYYMAKIENDFSDVFTLTCHPPDLVWKEQLCRCDWPELELDPKCGDLRSHPSKEKHMYQQLINGRWEDAYCNIMADNMVWVEDQCKCNWDMSIPQMLRVTKNKQTQLPKANTDCKVLVNLTMENSLENHVREGYRAEIKKKSSIRFFKINGSTGLTAVLRRAPITIPVLVGNDLTHIMHTSLKFKVHKNKKKYDKFIILMTNGCTSYKGKEDPSLELGFAPFNQTFSIKFRTYGKTVQDYFKSSGKAINDWYNLVLYLQDRRLTVRINEEIAYTTRITGKVAITACPLQITDNKFEGYIDEVLFIKQCKYPRSRKA